MLIDIENYKPGNFLFFPLPAKKLGAKLTA